MWKFRSIFFGSSLKCKFCKNELELCSVEHFTFLIIQKWLVWTNPAIFGWSEMFNSFLRMYTLIHSPPNMEFTFGPKIFLILYPSPEFFTTGLTITSNEDLEGDNDTDVYHVSPNVPRQVYIASRSSSSHVFTIPKSTNLRFFFTIFSLFCFSTR